MARKAQKEIFMTFPADEGQLEDIRRSIRNVLNESDLSVKDVNGVLLAIEEACTNVIRHAYLYGPGNIRIKITLQPGRVKFSIFDKGRAFDYDHSDTPDLDRYIKTGRKGGLGLYLIRKMMDSVNYYSRDGENELRLEKRAEKARTIRPRGLSLRVKFALWASLVVFAIVAGVYLIFDKQAGAGAYASFFRSADDAMNSFVTDIGDKLIFRDPDLARSASAWLSTNDELFTYIAITDTLDIIIIDPINTRNFLSRYQPLDEDLYNSEITVEDTSGIRQFHFKKQVNLNSNIVGYAYFGLAEGPLLKEVSSTRRGLFFIAIAGLFIGFISVYLLSNYFVKPIQKLTEGVLRIGDGNLEQTLPVEGTDEFSDIARAFNEITTKFKKAQENVVEQERMQKEMQVAQEIQHALLPRKFPDVDGYDIATIYRAAKDVGGDYFDFVRIDEHTMGVIVADVSGKGVPGSLVMTMIRTALRLESMGNLSPTDILSRVNKFVADDVKKGMFITIFFITLDSKNRTISYTSAGHNPMILYRKDSDSCYFLNTRGMPLGISLPDGVTFEDSLLADRVRLKKDDMLIVYTDGITEAMNNAGDQYGNDRLIEFIRENSELAPEEFSTRLDSDINKFTAGAPQNDDITLVVIKEKIMLDEIVFENRKKLMQMVESGGVPIEDACKEMGVSVSTFYKYRRRWQKFGDSGLLNKNLRAESIIKQVPYEVRKEILNVVRENPEFGAKRIAEDINKQREYKIDQKSIYDELIRMRLNTHKLRLEYVSRMGEMTEQMRTELNKEILKEKTRKDKVDREAYLSEIKESIEKREKPVVASGVVEKFKELEPEIGDAGLYSEIAAELGKLSGGEDLAKLFEGLISKMADARKAELEKERAVPQEKTVDPEPAEAEISIEQEMQNSLVANPDPDIDRTVPENQAPPELSKDSTPIDVIENASEMKNGKAEKKLDWEDYGRKLVKKFDKDE